MQKSEEQFNEAMRQIYDKAKDLKPPYKPNRFRKMVDQYGGKQTAEILLNSQNHRHEGLTQLVMRGQEALKLTVEYLVLQPEFSHLFNSEQLDVAKNRLKQLNIDIPK